MMRDFDRGHLQDRLPDYVHGTLPADERAALEAALAGDEALATELALVRAVRAAFIPQGRDVAVDRLAVDRVVAALPRPYRSRAGLTRVARLRVAAAIATLAVGGASLAVVQRSIRADLADSLVVWGESAGAAVPAELHVSFGYDLSALDVDDLEALLADLERAAGLPAVEPRRTVDAPVPDEGES